MLHKEYTNGLLKESDVVDANLVQVNNIDFKV